MAEQQERDVRMLQTIRDLQTGDLFYEGDIVPVAAHKAGRWVLAGLAEYVEQEGEAEIPPEQEESESESEV